jgi:hypothetical protein
MGVPVSIRLDDDVRDELEAQAPARGVGRPICATSPRRRLGRHGARVSARRVPLSARMPLPRPMGELSTTVGARRGPMLANRQAACPAGWPDRARRLARRRASPGAEQAPAGGCRGRTPARRWKRTLRRS